MTGLYTRLTTVRSANPDVRRRGRILIVVALAIALLALLFIPSTIMLSRAASGLPTIIGGALIAVGAALLGRAGQVDAGAYLLIGTTLLATAGSIALDDSTPNTPFYLVLPVLMAGVLLPPVQIWLVTALAIIGVALATALLPPELRADPLWLQAIVGAPLLLLAVALLTFISARSLNGAITEASQARAAAEAAGAELVAANLSLEARVAERTAEIQRVLAAQQATSAELAASLQVQRALNQLITEIALPVIPLSAEVLAVPLVGGLDSARIGQLLDTVLERVAGTRARIVILDVTGVPIIDTQVAAALLRIATATRLMGAETMLCGIRPEVAQTLVHLGVDLGTLRTAATLQDGLAWALAAPGR